MNGVREVERNADALAVGNHHVVAEPRPGEANFEELHPDCILSFGGLCLCPFRDPEGTGNWWMGQLDASDGSNICWSPYSDDLGEAIRHV